jgi:hypothetical protein
MPVLNNTAKATRTPLSDILRGPTA